MANKIVLELLADSSGLIKGLNAAQSQVEKFTKSADGAASSLGSGVNRAIENFKGLAGGGAAAAGVLAGAFAVAATAALNFTINAGKIAEQTDQIQQKTGIAAKAIEGMTVALARNNLEASSLVVGVKGLAKAMGEMRDGSASGVKLMQQLGLSLETVEKGTGATLRAVADVFAKMPDGADKARLAVELFGKSGLDLIPILNKGSAGLDDAMRKSAEFGLVLTDTARNSLTTFDDAMDDLSSAVKGFGMQIGVAFAPSFTALVNAATQAIVGAKNIFNQFADAAETLAIRLSAMVVALQLIGSQLLSTSVFSKEAWKQTLEQVKAVDQWADAQRAAVASTREADKELATLAQKQLEAAQAADVHAASQQRLGEQIVRATQIQVKQAEAAKLAAGLSQSRQGSSIVSATQIQLKMQDELEKAEERRGNRIQEEFAVRQSIAQKEVDILQAEEDAFHARFVAEFEAEKKAEQNLGQFMSNQFIAAEKTKAKWVTIGEQIEQSLGYAFGQIRTQFTNTITNVILGTGRLSDVWQGFASLALNTFLQLGIQMIVNWAKTQGMMVVESTVTAATIGAIFTGLATSIVGIFGTITGAIQGFLMETLIPMFIKIGAALMTFLSAIAEASADTIFGIPYAVAILAGVAVIGAAIGTLAAFAFAKGGIATGPTMGLIGEAGSSEAVIPLNKRGAAFMQEALGGTGGGSQPIHTHVFLDGKEIAVAIADPMMRALRGKGLPA